MKEIINKLIIQLKFSIMENKSKKSEQLPKGWGWSLILKIASYAITALAGLLTGNTL